MPKILQVNTVAVRGSTGRISEEIGLAIQKQGWESYIAYGKRNPTSKNKLIKIQSKFDFLFHVLLSRLFGLHGYYSKKKTQKFIEKIKDINPDIIHLHNVHGYYLHIPIFFEFLANYGKPVIWTLHDCWAITGHCTHFEYINCNRWQTGCYKCPLRKEYPSSLFFDRSKQNYKLKQNLFNAIPNLHIVSVSTWLENLVTKSFIQNAKVGVINNGIDLKIFKLRNKKSANNNFQILGVASVWTKTKGLEDFIKLRNLLDSKYEITIIGLSHNQVKLLPKGINGIERTDTIEELVDYYSNADVFVNTTYADTFPTVNLEALACGTPVITYKTGGSPETVSDRTGIVVEQGNVEAIASKIRELKDKKILFYRTDCIERVAEKYEKNSCYNKYIELYESYLKCKK